MQSQFSTRNENIPKSHFSKSPKLPKTYQNVPKTVSLQRSFSKVRFSLSNVLSLEFFGIFKSFLSSLLMNEKLFKNPIYSKSLDWWLESLVRTGLTRY